MTNMKRLSVSLSDEIVDALHILKQSEEYRNCSYSEIIRQLIRASFTANTALHKEKGA